MLIPPKNTVYKLAKGADNPSVDLVNTIECGNLGSVRQVITSRQVGVVKSTAAVGRTSTSAQRGLVSVSNENWADIDVNHVEWHLTLASLV